MQALLFLPPIVLAIALVVGAANAQERGEVAQQVIRTFFLFAFGVAAFGGVITAIARIFSG